MKKLKITLIGAGSRSFGPSSVRDVLLSEPINECGVELVLMDKVAEYLHDVEAYARHVAKTLSREAAIEATTDLKEAVDGADFVITAIDFDRFLYWSQDFHIPRKHGFLQVFGENGGPGGLFHALRNMTPTLEIARAMENHCPGAYLLNFSNPEHKLCEAISRLTSVKNAGLCHGVFMGLEQMAAILDMPVEDIDGRACGMNHFTFFESVRDRKTGEDLYPRLRQREKEGDWLWEWHEYGMARILFRRFGLWPSPAPNHYGEYVGWANEFVAGELQYFYDPADGHPWETRDVPEFVYSLGGHVTKRPWVKPDAPRIAFEEQELRASGELAVPIIESVACGVPHYLPAINVTNNGAVPNLPDDMVVEVPADGDADGLHNQRMAPLPEGIAAMIRLQGSIHKLLVEAYAEGSRDKLLQAMLLDPTVNSYRRAVECIDEMIGLQGHLLPTFS